MPVEGVRRPAWAEISTSALAHNVGELRRVLGPTALCAVVKANGYGHGAPLAARAVLDGGADSLAVAIVDEGIELREAGVDAPILLLAEVPAATVPDALAAGLTLTVGSPEGARAAVAAAEAMGGRHRVHLKVDTGMRRMGVAPEDAPAVLGALAQSAALDVEGVYTHFSVADGDSDDDRAFTRAQLGAFDAMLERLGASAPRVAHAANSAGALAYPESRRSMARVGPGPLRLPAEPVDRRGGGRGRPGAGAHAARARRRVAPGARGRAAQLRATPCARRATRGWPPCPSATPTATRAGSSTPAPRC